MQYIGPVSFSDFISPERTKIPSVWHYYLYNNLVQLPTLCQSTICDLKLEIEIEGIQFRYWVSRSTLYDRPQVLHADGSYSGYIGGWPRVEIEALIDGRWELIDGYQGHTV